MKQIEASSYTGYCVLCAPKRQKQPFLNVVRSSSSSLLAESSYSVEQTNPPRPSRTNREINPFVFLISSFVS